MDIMQEWQYTNKAVLQCDCNTTRHSYNGLPSYILNWCTVVQVDQL